MSCAKCLESPVALRVVTNIVLLISDLDVCFSFMFMNNLLARAEDDGVYNYFFAVILGGICTYAIGVVWFGPRQKLKVMDNIAQLMVSSPGEFKTKKFKRLNGQATGVIAPEDPQWHDQRAVYITVGKGEKVFPKQAGHCQTFGDLLLDEDKVRAQQLWFQGMYAWGLSEVWDAADVNNSWNCLDLFHGVPLLRLARYGFMAQPGPKDLSGILNANALYSFATGILQLVFGILIMIQYECWTEPDTLIPLAITAVSLILSVVNVVVNFGSILANIEAENRTVQSIQLQGQAKENADKERLEEWKLAKLNEIEIKFAGDDSQAAVLAKTREEAALYAQYSERLDIINARSLKDTRVALNAYRRKVEALRDVLKGRPRPQEDAVADEAEQERDLIRAADAVVRSQMLAIRNQRNEQMKNIDCEGLDADEMDAKIREIDSQAKRKLHALSRRLSEAEFDKDRRQSEFDEIQLSTEVVQDEATVLGKPSSRRKENEHEDAADSESNATSEEDEDENVKIAQVKSKRCVWPSKFKTGKHALLILQSAGQTEIPEDAIKEDVDDASDSDTDDDDDQREGPYLIGSGHNAVFVRDFYIEKGVDNQNIKSVDFSVDAGNADPASEIRSFLKDHKDKHRIIYYCGHGCRNGAWAFRLHGKRDGGRQDVYVTKSDMVKWVNEFPSKHSTLGTLVISQSCYSGKWCKTKKFSAISSATSMQCSKCTKLGSKVTRFLFDGDCPFELAELGSTPQKNF